VATIGQAPRDDLTPELRAHLPGVEFVERGALDGMSRDAVEALAPRAGEEPLVTRMADGTSVVIGHDRILGRLQAALADLESHGTEATIFACTGAFPGLVGQAVVRPSAVLRHVLMAYAASGYRIGIICPLPEQIPAVDLAWRSTGAAALIAAADPYAGSEDALAAAAGELAHRGATLLALDCLGYRERDRAVVRAATRRPTILSRSVVARLTAELIGCPPP
jgi:protein AroM